MHAEKVQSHHNVGVESKLLAPNAEQHFISDDVKVLLGMPTQRPPTMALGMHRHA